MQDKVRREMPLGSRFDKCAVVVNRLGLKVGIYNVLNEKLPIYPSHALSRRHCYSHIIWHKFLCWPPPLPAR